MVGPSGRVVAFGTYPMNNKIAKLNALLNNCVNIDFVDSALGSTAGLTTASVGEQCIVLKNFDANDVIPLKLATLDKYAELRPNFIKNRY
jgi:hypothetical protein